MMMPSTSSVFSGNRPSSFILWYCSMDTGATISLIAFFSKTSRAISKPLFQTDSEAVTNYKQRYGNGINQIMID